MNAVGFEDRVQIFIENKKHATIFGRYLVNFSKNDVNKVHNLKQKNVESMVTCP